MATQATMPRSARSQSPSAKFYSRTFSTRRTSHSEGHGPVDQDMISSAPHSKRRKLNPVSDTESAKVSQPASSRQRDSARPKRATEIGGSGTRAPRASTGNAYTKRASALNLHNYPTDHHPVGVAIWVIQKVDSARRERTGSASSRESSPAAFQRPSSRAGIFQAPGQASEIDEADDPVDRRQAQRERKIKQRLENWAKNKENDVVARAKLDAKKKFGSNPSTKPILLSNGQVEKPSPSDEKEAYIRKRIRDDFTRLMNRQTKVFADEVSQLEPFQVGFSQTCFPDTNPASGSDAKLVAAGRLLVNLLPALAEKEVSRTSQLAADSLIQALETGSLSPESFFDAIAILADNDQILVGTDLVLSQLFSRSASSGNSKALRTSSGADSKLFATTNGPFIIYNTIENTETTGSRSSRRSRRPLATTISAPAQASSRDQKDAPKMLGVSDGPARLQLRTSTSPRYSPPKVLKPPRPSKLRGTVSFANSSSPPRTRAKLTEETIKPTHNLTEMQAASNLTSSTENCSLNQYRSEQPAPPKMSSRGEPLQPLEINKDLVQNLFGLASFASQDSADHGSDLGDEESSTPNGGVEIAPPSVSSSRGKEQDDQHSSTSHISTKPAAHSHGPTSLLDPAPDITAEKLAHFARIIEQLPTSETKTSQDQVEKAAALYDELAQGPAFEKATAAGFSYPEIPRPFTDRDGWKLTGVINELGEEMVEIDRQSWVYPSYRHKETQHPLRRFKRKAQLEQELIFGFPPLAGCGNKPQHKRRRLEENGENVLYEKMMFYIRKEAERRGLAYNQTLKWEELARSIESFNTAHGITHKQSKADPVVKTADDKAILMKNLEISHAISFENTQVDPVMDFANDEPDDSTSSRIEASDISEIESDDDSDYEPETFTTRNIEADWSGINGAQTSSFITVNRRRESLRKRKDQPSSSTSSVQGNRNRAMEISTILDSARTEMSPPFRPNASSPPSSITKYDIRPPTASGTFNTFNGPITSTNTPAASPVGTPSFMKLNFHLSGYQSSTSPAPTSSGKPFSTTRRQSTASLASLASSASLASFASRPPSTQPLDIDNTAAYNVAKGYITPTNHTNTTTTATTSSSHSAPGSPNGLNGGFPGGGIIINAPDKRGDGRGQRRKSKAPDFKMTVHKAGTGGPKVQPRAVRGGTVLKFS